MIVIIVIPVFVIISASMLLTCILAEMCYMCIIMRHYGDVIGFIGLVLLSFSLEQLSR